MDNNQEGNDVTKEDQLLTSAPISSPRGKRPVKTALHQAVLDGRIHQVRLLVEKHGATVDSKDVFGRTPLMLACLLENEEYGNKMGRIFLKAGACINIKDNMKRTALHYACMKGRLILAKWLTRDDTIAMGDGDNDGNTPLMLACLGGNPGIVEILVDRILSFGLSVDVRNAMGYTALMLACKYGHYASAYLLLTKGGAQSNLRDNEYFLNAQDWVQKSGTVGADCMRHRSHTAPPLQRFDREHSLYMGKFTPVCCHVKPPTTPMGLSLDTALQLPALFQNRGDTTKPDEAFIEGRNARMMLLREIEGSFQRAPTTVKSLPTNISPAKSSRVSSFYTAGRHSAWTVRSEASTKKLIAIAGRTNCNSSMKPTMRTLFNLYCDQYDGSKASPEEPHKVTTLMLGRRRKEGGLPDLHVQFQQATQA